MVSVYQRAGSPFWYARLQDPREPDNEKRVSTKCSDEGQALDIARAAQAEIDRDLAESDGIRWVDAAADLIDRGGLKASTALGYFRMVPTIERCLGNFNLKALSPDKVKAFVRARRQEKVYPHNLPVNQRDPAKGRPVTDATIRRQLSFISSVIQWTIDQDMDGAPEANIMKSFDRSKIKESKTFDRHLRPDQFSNILSAVKHAEHRRILTVLVGTGMRSGELVTLKWSEVDFSRGVIEFGNNDPDKTKSGQSRIIPLVPQVIEALTAQKSAHSEKGNRRRKRAKRLSSGTTPVETVYVFPGRLHDRPRKDLQCVLKGVKRRTGLKSYRNHNLRHTFGSWAIQQDIDLLALQRVMGHADVSTTGRYAKHVEESLKAQFAGMRIPVAAQSTAHTNGFDK